MPPKGAKPSGGRGMGRGLSRGGHLTRAGGGLQKAVWTVRSGEATWLGEPGCVPSHSLVFASFCGACLRGYSGSLPWRPHTGQSPCHSGALSISRRDRPAGLREPCRVGLGLHDTGDRSQESSLNQSLGETCVAAGRWPRQEDSRCQGLRLAGGLEAGAVCLGGLRWGPLEGSIHLNLAAWRRADWKDEECRRLAWSRQEWEQG